MTMDNKIVEFNADIPALWKLQCKNLYNSKNLAALAVRECVQNSIDSILQALKAKVISKGLIDISWDTNKNTLTISDNGMGMDIPTLHTKFLTLGGTTKGDAESTGGFGLAKSVILGCGTGFHIHTQDNEFSSDDIGNNPIHKTTFRQGTTITLYSPQVDVDKTINDEPIQLRWSIEDYVYTSIIPKNITVTLNGKPHPNQFTSTKKSHRLPAELGISSDMIPSNTTLELNVFKTNSSIHYLYVRLRGLTQFKTYLSWNANCDVVLDFQTTIGPRSSEYPFSTNREGLKAAYQGIVEAIRDKVSQSPTSIAQDERYKETLYENVNNVSAARNIAAVITNKQVTDTVKAVSSAVESIKQRGGFTPQGGYTPVTVMDYVSQTANVIEQAAEQCNTTTSKVIQYAAPETLFQVNNPLQYSWIIYEDTESKIKKMSQSSTVSLVIVWDSIVKLMASAVGYLFKDKNFYPGIVYQTNTMGMCLEKTIYPKGKSAEQRQYIMLNPLEIPTGSPMKIALYLMGNAAHELAHLSAGSFEAHGETHSYTRELIMNENLDNVDSIIDIIKSSKINRILNRSSAKNLPTSQYKSMSLDELKSVAMNKGIDVESMCAKYANEPILRMRLTMALKKMDN